MKFLYKTVALIFLAICFSVMSYSVTATHASGGPGFPTPTPPVVQPPPTSPPSQQRTVRVWIQITDSCRQALPSGTFTITGPGVHLTTSLTSGGARTEALPTDKGQCPVQEGTCLNNFEGCVSALLPINATYTVNLAKLPPGHNVNLRYATCEGGSVCPHPQAATIHIAANGSVSATTLNTYPDGTTITYPTDKKAFSGTQSNPVMFHLFGIGNGKIQCDGDHDADDYLTGKPGSHCDSDKDKR